MIKTDAKMTMAHFHDFYFLQAVEAGIMTQLSRNPELQFSRAVEKLQMDLQEAMDEIIPNLALRTFVYLYAACLGEARHAVSDCAKNIFLPSTTNKHRGDLFGMVTNYEPTRKNLNTLIKVFEQDWRNSFGGKSWLNIANALPLYFTMKPAAFIDHIVDLEHNTGTAFSKEDAYQTLEFDVNYESNFTGFLDYKFRYDILTHPYKRLQVTRRVYNIVKRYCVIFNVKTPDWVVPGLAKLTDYVIQWGSQTLDLAEKWHEWVDVSKDNKPIARKLYFLSGIEAILVTKYTQKELKHEIKNAKVKAKEIAGSFLTPHLNKQLNKRFKTWLKWAQEHCKAEKAKVTYKVLPFKVTNFGEYLKLQFALPYQGIGTKTDFGFELLATSYPYDNRTILAGSKNQPGYDGRGTWADGYATLDGTYISLHLENHESTIKNKQMEALLR